MDEQSFLKKSKKNSQNFISSREAAKAYGVTHDYITQLARKKKLDGEFDGRFWTVDKTSLVSFFAAKGRTPVGGLEKLFASPQEVQPASAPAPVEELKKISYSKKSFLHQKKFITAGIIAAILFGNVLVSAAPQIASVMSNPTEFLAAVGHIESPFFSPFSFFSKIISFFAPNPLIHSEPIVVAPSQPSTTSVPTVTNNNYTTNNTTNHNTYNTTNNYATTQTQTGISRSELDSSVNGLRNEIYTTINGISSPSTPNYAGGGVTNNIALSQVIDQLEGVTISNSTVHHLQGLTDDDIPDTITVANYLPLSGGTITGDLTVTGTCTGCGGGGSGADNNWSYFNNSGIKLATTSNQVVIGASSTSTLAKLEVVGGANFDEATSTSFFTTTSSSTNSFSTFSTITVATIGSASTTNFYGSGLNTCNAGNVLTWDNGIFSCAQDQTAAGAANPFTWSQTYGVIAAATTSAFWAQNGIFASSTSHFTNLDFAFATGTSLSLGFASTTNFTISSIGSGSLLKTTTGGAIVAAVAGTDYLTSANIAAFPFTPSNFGTSVSNATSTLIGFMQGIYALASSTIGDGTQAGGLTILGGATTTGALNVLSATATSTFAGKILFGTTTANVGDATFVVGNDFSTNGVRFVSTSSNLLLAIHGSNTQGSIDIMSAPNTVGIRLGAASPQFIRTGNIDFGDNTASLSTIGVTGNLAIGQNFVTTVAAPSNGLLVQGKTSIGSSSPYALLSVHATSTGSGITTLFAIGSSTQTATSTLFSVSNTGSTTLFQIPSSLLKTNSNGTIVAAVAGTDYLTSSTDSVGNWFTPSTFGTSASNATSTLIGFNSGLYSLASSTIGDGTQAGGLTISGGATTTGNAYFGGNLGIGTSNPLYRLSIENGSSPGPSFPQDGYGFVLSGTGGANGNNRFASVEGNKATYFLTRGTASTGELSTYDYGAGVGMPLFINANGGNVSFGSPTVALSSLGVFGNLALGSYAGTDAAPTNGLIVSGDVGVGTALPQAALDVRNDIFVRNTDGAAGSGDGVEIATDASAPRVSLVQGGRYVGFFGADAPGNLYLKNTAGGSLIFTGGSSGSVETARLTNDGFLGLGTSSSFANLAVHANNGGTNKILFAIGSSTQNSTTTLFSIDNTGVASTTKLFGASLTTCNSGNVLTWNGGLFGCTADQTSTGQANPFTYVSTNFNTLTAATTSILWAQNGIFASSTSHFTKLDFNAATSTGLSYFSGGILANASTTIGNGTQIGGLTINGGATTTGALVFSGSKTYSGASSANNSFIWMGGGVNISGAASQPIDTIISPFHLLIAHDTVDTTTSGNGSLAGFSMKLQPDTDHTGTRQAIRGTIQIAGAPATGQEGQYVGIQGYANTSFNLLGTGGSDISDYHGAIFGGNTNVFTGSGATYLKLITSQEFDTSLVSGSSAARKIGLLVVKGSTDAVRGTFDDQAIQIADQDGASVGWTYGLAFGAYSAKWAFSNDSTLIGAITRVVPAANTPVALNGVDFRNVTFSTGGYQFAGPGFGVTNVGNVGIGSTSPFAKLSVQASSTETFTTLFAIASSTQISTTTLFSVSNTGLVSALNVLISASSTINGNATTTGTFFAAIASSTNLYGAGLNTCNSGNVLTWANGIFGCAADQTSTGQANPFTWTSNFGVISAATSSLLWAQSGFFASSTSQVDALNLGFLGFNATSSTSTLATFAGQTFLIASTTNFNTGLGLGALANVTTATSSTAFGYQALMNATSSAGNTAVGYQALLGSATISNTGFNTAFGYQALTANTSGNSNVAIGYQAFTNNTTGVNTVAIGYQAAKTGTTGSGTYIGYVSGQSLTTGFTNTCIGNNSCQSLTQGSANTTLGGAAGVRLTTGSSNILIGIGVAGAGIQTGKDNIVIGNSITVPSVSLAAYAQLDIGNLLFGNNIATTTVLSQGQLGVGTTSPFARFSVHANNGDTNATLFAIGSSTQTATSTLFSVSSTGSTTLFQIPSSLLKTDSNGTIVAAVAGQDYQAAGNYANFSYLFPSNATSTQLAFNGGLTTTGATSTGTFAVTASTTIGGLLNATNGALFAGATSTSFFSSSLNSLTAAFGQTGSTTITSAGFIGIGTSTPFANLSIHNLASSSQTVLFAIGSTTNISGIFSTSTLFLINNIGNVGIGSSSPTARLSVLGADSNIAASGAPLALLVQGGLGSTTGAGGGITLLTGTGGANAGAGGAFTITGGNGGSPSSGVGGVGGALNFTSGNGGNGASGNNGNGGAINFTTGNAGTSNAVGNGGNFTFTAGNITGAGNGVTAGSFSFLGGNVTNTSAGTASGGSFTVLGGYSMAGSATGGSISLTAGAARTNNGGAVTLTTGAATSTGSAGVLTLQGGIASSSTANANAGIINLIGGAASSTVSTVSGGSINLLGGTGGTGAQTVGSGGSVSLNGGAAGVAGGSVGNVLLGTQRGNVGVGGTTTPFALLTVFASSTYSNITNNLFAIASTTGTATSTLFSISNTGSTTLFQIPSSLLKTDANGTIVAAVAGTDYLTSTNLSSAFAFTPTTFGSTAANSTSTLIGFTQGLYALASSTIGNGNQNGGLTINGGATTTGNAYIAGSLGIGLNALDVEAGVAVKGSGYFQGNAAGDDSFVIIDGPLATDQVGLELSRGGALKWLASMNVSSEDLSFYDGTKDRLTLQTGGNVGIGSTTPFANLSVQKTYGTSGTTLFAIGSSTDSNDTTSKTFFKVDAVGSTTLASTFGQCSGSQVLNTNSSGTIVCGTISATGDGVGTWFTPTTNFGATANSTSTPIWFQAGLQASSTANLVDTNIFGKLGHLATSSSILETFNAQTFLTATTTSNGQLTLGYQAGNALLASTTNDAGNTAIGYQSLLVATSSVNNTAFGYQTLLNTKDFSNGGGTNVNNSGSANSAFGWQALLHNTSGSNNNAVGTFALVANTTGHDNNAQGQSALDLNTTGSSNVGIGSNALYGNSTGSNNTALGSSALAGNFSTFAASHDNTAIGDHSGYSVQGAALRNTLLGVQAGYSLTTGDANIILGAYADLPSASGNGQLNLGNVLYGTGLYNASTLSAAPVTNGNLGVGTTTPYAQFGIHAINGSTNTTLFAIGSSTQTATTTLFTVTNTGNVGIGTTTPFAQLSIQYPLGTPCCSIALHPALFQLASSTASGGTVDLLRVGGGFAGAAASAGSANILVPSNSYIGTAGNADTGNTGIKIVLNSGEQFYINGNPNGAFQANGPGGSFGFQSQTSGYFGWGGTGAAGGVTADTVFMRPSAGVVTLGTNGSANNINGTFATNYLGLGTTTPYAQLSIIATSSTGVNSPTMLFAIASTTSGTATSTLFSISNVGSTTLGLFGACSGSNALTTDSSGTIVCGALTTNGGSFPFTPNTNFGLNVNATSTPIWFTAGLQASSTSYFDQIIVGSTTASTLATSSFAGVLSIGSTTPFGGSLFTVGTSSPLLTVNKSTGFVGIGTASPAAALEISGATGIKFSSQTLVLAPSASNQLVFNQGNSDRWSLSGTGINILNTVNGGITWTSAFNQVANTSLTRFANGIVAVGTGGLTNSAGTLIAGNIGLGTTSPYAQLSIVATSTTGIGNSTTLFAIASTTGGTATSTLFSIDNTGSTTIGLFGTCSGSSALNTTAAGLITCGAVTTSGGSFSWTPSTFGATNANSTSTLIGFTQGLYALASSTIGDGTNGLTISGNATTTGNAYFANRVGIGTSTPQNIGVTIQSSTSLTNSKALSVADFDAATKFSVLNSGFVGLRTDATTTASLAIVGNTRNFFSTANLPDYYADISHKGSGAGVAGRGGTQIISQAATAGNGNAIVFAQQVGVNPATLSMLVDVNGNVGIASSSLFSKFAVHANNGDTANTLFVIGSSTASATSTLFSISNVGSTTLGLFGACSGSNALTTDSSGTIVCGALTTSGGSFPYTPTTNFNTNVNSTSTPIWFRAGLQASSTSQFDAGIFKQNLSVGSTSPYAYFSIHAASTTATTTLFAIGSTTASGVNSTLFSVDNVGNATTSGNAKISGALAVTGTSVLTGAVTTGSTISAGGNITFTSGFQLGSAFGSGVTIASGQSGSSSGGAAVDLKLFAGVTNNTQFVNINGSGFSFTPTTNSVNFANLQVTGLGINQTGSANGTTRGVYITPPFSNAAVDYRALEISGYGQNVARNMTNSYGVLLNQYILGSSSASTVTNAYGVTLGAPIASSSVTITNSVGLYIPASSTVLSTGVVTNSYAILANAQTGASNNYTAAFLGGNVGVGTSSPFANLAIHANNGSTNTTLFAIGSSTQTATTTLFVVTNTGNVGIGTTTPGTLFSIGNNAGINFSEATSTFNTTGGINITAGCYAINGACIGYTVKLAAIYATSTPSTATVPVSVVFTGAQGSAPSFSGGTAPTLTLPKNTSYIVSEVWGSGGGGGGGGTTNAVGGPGAGSGGYSQKLYASPIAAKYYYNVGKGGTGAANSTTETACTAGNDSTFGTGSATTTGGGAVVCTGVTAGGDGGSASGGDVNLSGGGGMSTSNNTGQTGGVGGSAPRGGGGGAGQGVNNNDGNVGNAPGGGGSGGRSAGNGGNGGDGGVVITVYATSSANSTGNDYAEMFPVSNPIITAGDIVAVDTGIPVSMKLAAQGDTAPLAGIVSTEPGQVLGDINVSGMRPIALSGRVPAKVNLEGGEIHIGDRIAPSSVPGIGKKASQFEDSVGIAIDNYTLTSTGGTVMVLLNLQRGIDIEAVGQVLLGYPIIHISSTSTVTVSVGDLGFGTTSATTTKIISTTTSAVSASSTPRYVFATAFMQGLATRLTDWLASAGNGIADLFAQTIHADVVYAKSVHTDELCVGATCVSQEKFLEMVNSIGTAPVPAAPANGSGAASAPQPTPEQAPTSTPDVPDTAASSTPPLVEEPVATSTPPAEPPAETPPDASSTPMTP
jgi:hypothetical protein